MLERGTESAPAEAPAPEPAGRARFTRAAEHFATARPARDSDATGGAA